METYEDYLKRKAKKEALNGKQKELLKFLEVDGKCVDV